MPLRRSAAGEGEEREGSSRTLGGAGHGGRVGEDDVVDLARCPGDEKGAELEDNPIMGDLGARL